MTTTLATWLRIVSRHPESYDVPEFARAAANEIERLQAEVSRLTAGGPDGTSTPNSASEETE